MKKSLDSLEQVYLDDNLETFKKLYCQTAFTNPEANLVYQKLITSLLDDRDAEMAQNLHEKFLSTPNTFIAVGCCHLPGLISRLTALGYVVEPVICSPRSILLSELSPPSNLEEFDKQYSLYLSKYPEMKNISLTEKIIKKIDNLNRDFKSRYSVAKYICEGKHGFFKDSAIGRALIFSVAEEGSKKATKYILENPAEDTLSLNFTKSINLS